MTADSKVGDLQHPCIKTHGVSIHAGPTGPTIPHIVLQHSPGLGRHREVGGQPGKQGLQDGGQQST
jgi:hypothetical protein